MADFIKPDTNVGRMLKEFPDTLAVLLAASPHFSKLKNPVLRKAFAGRVTVAQAARVAGIDLHGLLRDLNATIGRQQEFDAWVAEHGLQTEEEEKIPVDSTILEGRPEKVLDVRPIIDAGKEPFGDIMAAADSLQPDEVLHLINSFEPVPLYGVMAKKGFAHVTEKRDDVFHIYFYRREEGEEEGEPTPVIVSATSCPPVTTETVELDVRQLAPPEPLMRILEALNTLPEKGLLLVHHHREPMLLYDKLRERGFGWQVERRGENEYIVRIWKA
jgi:uncharacterized protein (DUF2249 family)